MAAALHQCQLHPLLGLQQSCALSIVFLHKVFADLLASVGVSLQLCINVSCIVCQACIGSYQERHSSLPIYSYETSEDGRLLAAIIVELQLCIKVICILYWACSNLECSAQGRACVENLACEMRLIAVNVSRWR